VVELRSGRRCFFFEPSPAVTFLSFLDALLSTGPIERKNIGPWRHVTFDHALQSARARLQTSKSGHDIYCQMPLISFLLFGADVVLHFGVSTTGSESNGLYPSSPWLVSWIWGGTNHIRCQEASFVL